MSRATEVALSTVGARRGCAGASAAGGEEAISKEGLVVAGEAVEAAPQAIEATVSRRADSCRGVIFLTVRA